MPTEDKGYLLRKIIHVGKKLEFRTSLSGDLYRCIKIGLQSMSDD